MLTRVVKRVALAILLVLLVPSFLIGIGVLPYKMYVVHTGSMEPTIPSESLVFVREGHYHKGQVISFYQHGEVVTHRYVGKDRQGMLITKGDANTTADSGHIPASEVIGGVVRAPQYLGWWATYVRSPAGLASLGLAALAAWLFLSSRKKRPTALPA